MTSEACHACGYQEPHKHGPACDRDCARCHQQACQHCYRKVKLVPSDDPGAPDRAVDTSGGTECLVGVPHKVLGVVA